MVTKHRFRISDRLEARRSSGQRHGPVLTAEDAGNLDIFAAKIQEAIDLLSQEVTAINEGRLNFVNEVFDDKAAILKWLELKLPLVEPFMTHSGATARKLPELLSELKGIVGEDSALLSRMAAAAGTIVREIDKARNRNSLQGNYGKKGEKVTKPPTPEIHLDREL